MIRARRKHGTVGHSTLWGVCCSRCLVTALDSKAANRFNGIQDPSSEAIFDCVDSGDGSRVRGLWRHRWSDSRRGGNHSPLRGSVLPRGAYCGFVFLSALAAQFYSQTAMGDSWRIGVDQNECPALVTRGPFAFVRNPIYSAAAVMSIALFLVLPNILMTCSMVAQTVGVELQVRGVEEPYLLNSHDQLYRDYASRVGRFVPFVGRLR